MTTKGCGSCFFIASAIVRATISVEPPAPAGTINVIGFSGYAAATLAGGEYPKNTTLTTRTSELAKIFSAPAAGIIFFTALTAIPAVTSLLTREPRAPAAAPAAERDLPAFLSLVREYRWIWYSSIVLIGITGVVASLYPKFSGASSEILGLWIAGMSIATIIAVLIISRFPFDEILAIRVSAVLMVMGVMTSFFSPVGFLVLGFLAGVVMIAQLGFLARVREHQGMAMGMFSTMSYLGMALLPFIAGLVADWTSFFVAFCVTAVVAGTVAVVVRG